MSDDKKKKKQEQDKLRFDTKRHDDKVERRKLDDHEREQKRYMMVIGDKFKVWKRRLCSKSRNQQEVIHEIHKFMKQISVLLWKCPDSYRETTLEIIEDDLAKVVATSCGRIGSVHQFLPEGFDAIPQTVQFNSKEEFEAIPWVKSFSDKKDFIGFCTDRNRIVAIYEGGKTGANDLPVVGSVIIPKKLRKQFNYPLLTELAKAINEKINKSN